mgnify:FL=1
MNTGMEIGQIMVKLFLSLGILIFVVSCSETDGPAEVVTGNNIDRIANNTVAYNSERNAYFGDLHVHSMYSYDAFIFGGIASPNDAYEFAKGGSIRHPAGFDSF